MLHPELELAGSSPESAPRSNIVTTTTLTGIRLAAKAAGAAASANNNNQIAARGIFYGEARAVRLDPVASKKDAR